MQISIPREPSVSDLFELQVTGTRIRASYGKHRVSACTLDDHWRNIKGQYDNLAGHLWHNYKYWLS